eukprot:5606195-Amphidinium_carterae.1
MRAPPPAEEEPTQEMLIALNHRIRVQNGTPYVDMGVWCPCGSLTARAQKFRTWIPSPSGGYISKEPPGPSCFAQWILSWRVFVVAAIMLKASSLSALLAYERLIE